MRELLLQIKAIFSGKQEAQEAKKAVDEVTTSTKDVGQAATDAQPKVEKLLDSAKKKAQETTAALKETAEAAKEVGDESASSGGSGFGSSILGNKPDPAAKVFSSTSGTATGSSAIGKKSMLEEMFPEVAGMKERAADLARKEQELGDTVKGMGDKAGSILATLGSLEAIVMRMVAVATAAKIGLEVGTFIQDKVFNWASSAAAGGWSKPQDQERAAGLVSDSGSRLTGFANRAADLQTTDQRSALLAEITAYQNQLISAKSSLGLNETAQRNEMDRTIQQLTDFWTQALSINPELVQQMQDAKAKAEADAAARAQAALENLIIGDQYSNALGQMAARGRFNQMSPDDQLRDLRGRQEAADTVASGRFGNEDPTARAAAAAESLKLLGEIQKLEEKIADDKEKQVAAEEKKKALAEELAGALEVQMRIDEERAKGNEDVAKRIEFEVAMEKELNKLRAAGVTDEKTLSDYAIQKKALFEANLSAKREELSLETSINEAKAQGNDEEAKKLQWLLDVNKAKAQGLSYDEAARAVNAEMAADEAAKTNKPTLTGPAPSDNPYSRLQKSPFGPSGIDAPVDVTKPAQPRDLSKELAPKGSEGYGTDGGDAVPGAPKSSNDKGGSDAPGAKDVASFKQAMEGLQKLIAEIAKAAEATLKAAEAQKAAEKIASIGDAVAAADQNLQNQIDDLNNRI